MAQINFSALGFYGKNRKNYRELWEVLGRTWTGLAAEAAWAVETIPGRDHGFLKFPLADEQQVAMLPILSDMGFFRALKIPTGQYTELEITGAKYNAIVGRVTDVKRHLDMRNGRDEPQYRFGRIVCQFGQRPRTDVQDGTITDIVSSFSDSVLAHSWVQQELERHGEELFEGPFATEFELGILAFIVAYDGHVQVSSHQPSTDTTSLPGIPLRSEESCELRLPDGTPVLVINCPAVERKQGPPRPTTISSVAYRMEHYPPNPFAHLVGVTGPTHGYRVMRDLENRIHQLFPEITVFGLSRSTDDPMRLIGNALAEAVWLLQLALEEMLAEI